ncbi:DUF2231 domain-containing protein [Zobellella sp. DQSA1]|uniref:DUF2231 domain-containing protein n=1 Tax=Zobellella sp. DQSA1 TaxID=3342386 RepID=UPI0035BF3F5C
MTGMHHMLVHFPLALWALAALMVLVGVCTRGAWGQISRSGLPAVLILAWLGALAAIVTGLLVWPTAANLSSPLTRNHLLMALWATALWTVITLLVWRGGARAFSGGRGAVLLILALAGSGLFTLTGTLGGHLAGAPTPMSQLLERLGWSVYGTFYLPYWALLLLVLLGGICVVAGFRKEDKGDRQ